MDSQNKEFSKIESYESKKTTFIVKVLAAFIFAGTVLAIINLGVIIIESKLAAELKFFAAALFVILLSFLLYFVLKDTFFFKKNKITKVIVDQKGLHHYEDEILIESLTFESLHSNPELRNYDVVVSEGEDTAYNICVYYFDNSRNAVLYKEIIFKTPFSIRNAKELKRHFIEGVLKFRSDLKVSPQVLALLNLNDLQN